MGYTFLYMFTASAYCLAIFLAVLAVAMAKKGWRWAVAGSLLLALSMGIYQAYACLLYTSTDGRRYRSRQSEAA